MVHPPQHAPVVGSQERRVPAPPMRLAFVRGKGRRSEGARETARRRETAGGGEIARALSRGPAAATEGFVVCSGDLFELATPPAVPPPPEPLAPFWHHPGPVLDAAVGSFWFHHAVFSGCRTVAFWACSAPRRAVQASHRATWVLSCIATCTRTTTRATTLPPSRASA